MLRARTLLLASVVVLTLAGGSSAASGPIQTALTDPGTLTGRDLGILYSRARAAGATAIRITIPWEAVAQRKPTRPTLHTDRAYDWARYDERVRLATAYRLEPLVLVGGAPAWAQGKPRGADRPDPVLPRFRGPFRPSAAEFGKFMRAAATRYSGRVPDLPRVRYWQAWGEPNVSNFLTPQFVRRRPTSPAVYRALLNAFADAVRAVRRDNVVIGGGSSPFTVRNRTSVTVAPLRFMRELLCLSKGPRPRSTCPQRVKFDIWAHHPYTSGGPTRQAFRNDDVSLGDLPEMERALRAAVRAGKVVARQPVRFWVTEFSWDTRPPDLHPRATPIRLHARWVSEAVYRMWKAGVSLVTWWQIRDDPYTASPYQAGLYFHSPNRRYEPNPALVAFRFPFVALRERDRIRVWGRAPGGRAAVVDIEVKSGSAWRRVATRRTNRHGIFTMRIPPSAIRRARVAAAPKVRTASNYSSVVVRDSPTSYWRLGERTGTVARDSRGASNGVFVGGVRLGVPGALVGDADRAVSLNGRGGRVRLGAVRSPRTVELWLKTSAVREAAAFSNRNTVSQYTFLGVVNSGNALAFDSLGVLGSRWVADGEWHHVVYTYDGAVGHVYVDGNLDASATFSRAEADGEAALGYDRSLRTYFKGELDEVAVYDYALSAGRVKAHFTASGRRASSSAQFQSTGRGTYFRARLVSGADTSLPFALARPPDRFVLPFGGGGG